jgi:hypothetical protein
MIAIVVFHVVMVLLALGVMSKVVPVQLVGNMLDNLHKTLGITRPPPEQTRTIALVWIGSTIIIVDGSVFLLVFITRLLLNQRS